jgi:hypothetical protein
LLDLETAPGIDDLLKRVGGGSCQALTIKDSRQIKWNLTTADGRCAFPIIRTQNDDRIFVAGRTIAKQITDTILNNDLRKLIGGSATLEQARLIEAYELMWEVLNRLEAEGLVKQPAILQTGTSSPELLSSLLVVIVKK